MIDFKIELTADDETNVIYALEHAIKQIEQGYTSGDLRTDGIDSGSWDITKVCDDCGGTGEITTMEAVYPDAGSPKAPIGTQKCHCQKRKNEDD